MSATVSSIELVTNAAGRVVPTNVNGQAQRAYTGVNNDHPQGLKAAPPIRSAAHYPMNGDKRVPDLETALGKCGLSNGMTISTHHHLRNGDRVALWALQTAAKMGARDLMWFHSASFPAHSAVIELMESGNVH